MSGFLFVVAGVCIGVVLVMWWVFKDFEIDF